MKKIILALLLIVLPVTVFAAEPPIVSKLELSNDKGVIKFNGETAEPAEYGTGVPSYAVMCKLFNSESDQVDLLSTEVNDDKFEGSFTVTKNDTYTVYCANYEGGAIKSETIKVDDIVNPKTGDNMYIYCIVLAVCITAGVVAAMYPRFLKKVKARRATKTTASKKTTSKKTTKKK